MDFRLALDFFAETLHFVRFYNDAWILTNGFLWLLAAPILAGFVIGGAGFADLFARCARAMMRDDRPLVGLTCARCAPAPRIFFRSSAGSSSCQSSA